MFEIPEMITIAKQMNQILPGKVISLGKLGNSPHKFVWYNRTHEEFTQLTSEKQVGKALARGRWLFLPLNPGFVLLLGECGGKILFHDSGERIPAKYHLFIQFSDGSAVSALTQMWGAMELYEAGKELERQYVRDMLPTPVDEEFTLDYFRKLVTRLQRQEKRSAKALLTQDQLIPGLGNSIAQDILFRARLHPRRPIQDFSNQQIDLLYQAVVDTVQDAIAQGGRADEVDFFGKPGGYQRLMDSRAVGGPCSVCGVSIEKISYLGGACYFCPSCQE